MAQNHNADYSEKPMTTYGRTQGPSRRYRRLRHPTFPAAEWTAKNPLLQRGEIGFEIDTHKAKVGDGTTYWNSLPYAMVAETEWGHIVGDINDQTDLKDALDGLQGQITDNKDAIDNHIADTNNPHSVTKAQVGLGNVDNTSDADKPISTATQNALDLKANIADLGTAAYTDSTDYATAAQGTKADSALQPGDNVSELVNNAGYLTQHQTLADLGITATATELNYVDGVTSAIQTQLDNKQPKSASAYNMGNTSGGWTAMSNTQQDALNSGANTTNIGQIATNTSNIADEIIDRQNADNGLQSQIDAIVSKSDVVDIVGTYAELQAYDTSSLGNNDVVKVISDSTHNNAPSYYRWVITGGVGAWVYIGSESETYTKAETDALLNAKQDNITATDGITLTGTTLTNSGVRAVASGTANGTISVNTNGTSADVAVTGLGSAAYTSSSDYATSAQGGKADTAVQPGDLATVATTGDYDDLINKPVIPTYSDFTGATAGDAGTNGLVPAPAAGDQGKFLQGDGTWASVDALPSQSGQSGKFLTTDGTDASWATISAVPDIDNSTITKNSSDELQAVATINANTAVGATNPVYDWVGTLQEYIDQDIENTHPDWICYITDDVSGGTSVYTKTEVDNNFVGKGHEVIEFQQPTSSNNYSWYRKYADGWVEQGGFAQGGYDAISGNIMRKYLYIPMANNKYTIHIQVCHLSTDPAAYYCYPLASSTTSEIQYLMFINNNVTTNNPSIQWMVCGMGA